MRPSEMMPFPDLRPVRPLLLLALAVGLGGCANISHDRDESIQIPAGAAVAFAGGRSEGRENLDPAVDNDIVHRRIQSAIAAQLEAKGYRMVPDAATADFLVRYYVGVRRRTEHFATSTRPRGAPAVGPGWGIGWGGGTVTTITPRDFTDVSFAVDLVERATGRTAWRGVWRGDPGTRAPTQPEIDATMARIFESAPAAR